MGGSIQTSEGSIAQFSCITSAAGYCVNDGLPAGTFQVDAEFDPAELRLTITQEPDGDGDLSASSWPILEEGRMRPIVFGFSGLGTIHGRVYEDIDQSQSWSDGDIPFPAFELTVTWAGIDQLLGTVDDVKIDATTGSWGTYRLENVPSGDYTVALIGDLGDYARPTPITLYLAHEGIAEVDFRFNPADRLPATGSNTSILFRLAWVLIALGGVLAVTSRRIHRY